MTCDITEIPYEYPELPAHLKDKLLAASCEIADEFGADKYLIPRECYDGTFPFIGRAKKLLGTIPVYGEVVVNTERTYPFDSEDIKDILGRIVKPKALVDIQNASGILTDFPHDKEIDWGDIAGSAVLNLHGYEGIDILNRPPKKIRLYKVILNINDAEDAFISSTYMLDFPLKRAIKLVEKSA